MNHGKIDRELRSLQKNPRKYIKTKDVKLYLVWYLLSVLGGFALGALIF